MQYSENYIKEVLSRINIVDVIGQYTNLSKQNNIYVGNCVFHKNDNSSLVIYPDKQTYHCFICGSGGNAATFLMEYKKIPMNEAIDELAKELNMQPQEKDIIVESNVEQLQLYDVYKDATIFYINKLFSPEGKEGLKYLKDRGLTDKTIEKFALGYSPTKGNSLYKYLKNKNYSDELLIKSGLIKISETGPYDMFRGRVMFPIINENKKVIAFGGRVMNNDIKPKYLNSSESPIFNKSNTLYGIRYVKKCHHDNMLLCEGFMDVISLHQAGYTNAVATLGTAFTLSHIPIVKKYTDSLILTFDCDGAGQKAAMRTIKLLKDKNLNVKILSMSPCKDPDEFIKTFGKDEYQDRINRSIDQTNFQLKYIASKFDLNNPEQKEIYLNKAVDVILSDNERIVAQTPQIERF